MGHKVESFQSNDGVLFGSEEAMLIHEATVDLQQEFPNIRFQIPYIVANIDRIAAILAPIHALNVRATADTIIETTRAADGSRYVSGMKPSAAPRFPCPGVLRYAGPKTVVTPLIREDEVDREDRGGCDCSASMSGNGPPHHPTCPMHRETAVAGIGCKAKQFSDQMQCEGCALVWDVNDGYTPYCKPEVYQNG